MRLATELSEKRVVARAGEPKSGLQICRAHTLIDRRAPRRRKSRIWCRKCLTPGSRHQRRNRIPPPPGNVISLILSNEAPSKVNDSHARVTRSACGCQGNGSCSYACATRPVKPKVMNGSRTQSDTPTARSGGAASSALSGSGDAMTRRRNRVPGQFDWRLDRAYQARPCRTRERRHALAVARLRTADTNFHSRLRIRLRLDKAVSCTH